MGQILFAVSANSVPYIIRANLYKTTSSNVVAYSQDIPLPHNASQALAFDPIDDGTYYVRLYELVSESPDVLGALLFEQIMSTKQKDLVVKLNLEIRAGTDMLAGQDIYDGSFAHPENNGLIALVDYWVEREGQGTFKEVIDYPPFGFQLDLDRDGNTVQFNPEEKFTLHFYPKVKITVGSGSSTPSEDVVEVDIDNTLIDASYSGKTININSPTKKFKLQLDFLASISNGTIFKFVTNQGNQINTVINTKPSEVFMFDCATALGYGEVTTPNPTSIIMGNNEFLILVKKDGYFHVQSTNVSYEDVGNIVFATRLKKNYIVANGAVDAPEPNQLRRDEYPRLFNEVSQMTTGVVGSLATWVAGNRTSYHLGDGVDTFGVPDLRGYFLRFADLGAGVDTDRNGSGLGSTMLNKQDDSIKAHVHQTAEGRDDNVVGAGTGNGARVTALGAGDSIPTGSVGGSEGRPKNIAVLPLIKI